MACGAAAAAVSGSLTRVAVCAITSENWQVRREAVWGTAEVLKRGVPASVVNTTSNGSSRNLQGKGKGSKGNSAAPSKAWEVCVRVLKAALMDSAPGVATAGLDMLQSLTNQVRSMRVEVVVLGVGSRWGGCLLGWLLACSLACLRVCLFAYLVAYMFVCLQVPVSIHGMGLSIGGISGMPGDGAAAESKSQGDDELEVSCVPVC